MLDIVLGCTNERIKQVRGALPIHVLENSKYTYFRETDEIELESFFGLLYMRGLLGQNNHSSSILFSAVTGHPVFSATMSQKRFEFLHSCISFDDITTRQERWKNDRFTAFRHIFSVFCDNCSKHIVPDEWLSLDETLFPMRNKISFKQYNKSKPSKYGLLFKSINAVRYSYTFTSLPYCGKPIDESSPFYISGTENAAKHLVENLEKHVDLQGRNFL